MTQYPHDRFDDVPAYSDRKGSHRASPSVATGSSGLVGISIAAAVALAVGAFSFLVLPSLLPSGASQAGGSASAMAAASASPSGQGGEDPSEAARDASASAETGEPDASPEPTSTPDSIEPSGPAEPTGGESTGASDPAESDPAADTGDASAPVEVYNASSIGGLAGRVSGTLSSSGFTVVGSGNWQGFSVPSSAVYYSQNETTAQAVAAELGLPLVYDQRIPGVAVVLNADYSG